MIRVDGLVKRFGDVHAVDGVSFQVKEGEIYGLLGPNGAGKTTTFSMLAGLLAPDSGRVTVGGVDLASDPSSTAAPWRWSWCATRRSRSSPRWPSRSAGCWPTACPRPRTRCADP